MKETAPAKQVSSSGHCPLSRHQCGSQRNQLETAITSVTTPYRGIPIFLECLLRRLWSLHVSKPDLRKVLLPV